MQHDSIYHKVIENMYDGLYLTDTDRVITYWNKAAERITGFSADEVIGRPCSDDILTHVDSEGKNMCQGMCPLADAICDGAPREVEAYLHHKDGHRVPVSIRVNTLTDEEGRIIGGVELFTDISNQQGNKLRVLELERLALLDNLTELANRHYMEQELENRMEEWGRYKTPFGLLFLDIDHFKQFNDTYGHDVGDKVLKAVAQTLVSNGRSFDLYGRWGGEEFVGIIRNISARALESLGKRVLHLVNSSYFSHEGRKLGVTVSIGGTVANESDTVKSLIKRADELMYRSKTDGRNRLTIG